MNLLNINSYFLSSSVHNTLEISLIEREINVRTYVPIQRDYVIRDECNLKYDKHINIIKCFSKYDRLLFYYKNMKMYRKLISLYEFGEFDLVHAHSLFTNGYLALKLKEIFGIPYVVTVRDTDINVFFKKRKYLKKLGNKILNQAEYVVFLSPSYKTKLINNYVYDSLKLDIEKKSVVIPNPIEQYWLDHSYLKSNNVENKIKIIYVGQINERKNLLKSIEAIKILINRGYKIEFSIIGKNGKSSLEKEFEKNNFINRIGQMSKQELIYQYRQNDIFLMPSITESFGLVYAEALSQGLPVIYTEGEGFDHQFEDGEVGYSVKYWDEMDIANKLEKIIRNYNELINKTTMKSMKFSPHAVSTLLLDIYNNVLNNKDYS